MVRLGPHRFPAGPLPIRPPAGTRPADHAFLRCFVIPESEEHRLPEQTLFGPLGELNLAHQTGLHPTGARLLRECSGAGRMIPSDSLQSLPDGGELLFGESAPCSSAVDQLPCAISSEIQ